MTTKHKQYKRLAWDDPAAWESDGRLRDGIAVRIPVSLMDATSKEVHDAALRSFNCRHRPGYRVAPRNSATEFFDARQRAYAEYEKRVTSAWRDGSDSEEGDICTIDGDAGTLQMVDGKLTCVADPDDTADAMSIKDHRVRMQKLYAARDAADAEEWRRG